MKGFTSESGAFTATFLAAVLATGAQAAVLRGIDGQLAPASAPAPEIVEPAAPPPPYDSLRRLRIRRVSRRPTIADYLTGYPAGQEASVNDFRQQEPGDGAPVSHETIAYLSYDENNIYVAFVCKDEPDKVRARMSKREDVGPDDRVTVYIDSFSDHRHAYYFTANPLGVQSDGLITEGQSQDDLFDTFWHSDGRLTADGYVVLISIPFKSVRFGRASAPTWGIALGRSIVRNGESSFWPYITNRRKNFVEQFAVLDGLEEISHSRNIQLIPYGAFTNAKSLDTAAARYQTQNEGRVGLDTKLVLRDSLTLDVTLNPDFSQVETDDPQVTVNKRYEVQFPEKRPFFIENSGYFATSLDLLFTRRIVDPEYGARLTGKVGPWAIGLLGADDRAPGKVVDPGNSLYGARAVIGAARIQRELGKDSKIGVLATSREFGASYNRVFSVDAAFRLSPTWYISGQAVRSYDRSYDDKFNLKKASGPGYTGYLAQNGRHFTYNGTYLDLSPDFRAPLGFIKRVDVRTVSQYVGYLFRPEASKILAFGPSYSYGRNWDHQGRLQDWYSFPYFSMDFKGPAGFTLGRYDAYERYVDQGFHYSQNTSSFYGNWFKAFTFSAGWEQGNSVNYSPATGLQPFLAKYRKGALGFVLRPKRRMRIEESYFFSWLGERGNIGSASAIFNNHLSRTRFNYQFTRALSFRGILDYNGMLPNSALFNSDKYKVLTGDLLLTYLLHPGTALYLGYNNRHENWALDPSSMARGLRRYGDPTYLTGTQVFLKLSYLLRF